MAIIEVKVPQLSESVAEATLLQWQKKVGEAVARDENLIDVETDKVVLELPAPEAGVHRANRQSRRQHRRRRRSHRAASIPKRRPAATPVRRRRLRLLPHPVAAAISALRPKPLPAWRCRPRPRFWPTTICRLRQVAGTRQGRPRDQGRRARRARCRTRQRPQLHPCRPGGRQAGAAASRRAGRPRSGRPPGRARADGRLRARIAERLVQSQSPTPS